MNRSELRDVIVKCLYQIYIYDENKIDYNLEDLIRENMDYVDDFIVKCLNGVLKNQEEISKLANKHMKDWSIDRLSKVDKAILSLGIYELKYEDTPEVVAINEAVELSKKYSDLKVTKMINAVLDNIYKEDLDG